MGKEKEKPSLKINWRRAIPFIIGIAIGMAICVAFLFGGAP